MEEQQTPKKLSTGAIIAIAVVLVIAIGAGTYAFTNNKATEEKADLNAKITELQNQIDKTATETTAAVASTATRATTATDETADWKTYTNDEYGFSLTFTDKWQGYKVTEKSGANSAEASYRVFVPTSSKTFSSELPGYADPFVVSIYKIATYNSLKENADPNEPFDLSYGSKLTENETYIATVSYGQDLPEDLIASGLDKEIKSVSQSFKFTK